MVGLIGVLVETSAHFLRISMDVNTPQQRKYNITFLLNIFYLALFSTYKNCYTLSKIHLLRLGIVVFPLVNRFFDVMTDTVV